MEVVCGIILNVKLFVETADKPSLSKVIYASGKAKCSINLKPLGKLKGKLSLSLSLKLSWTTFVENLSLKAIR